MTRLIVAVTLSGFFVGEYWNGPGAVSRYLGFALLVLAAAAFHDAYQLRKSRS